MLLLVGCKQEQPALERIVATPLENLSGREELDWLSAASTPLLVMKTAGSPGKIVLGANADREAAALRATHLVRGYYSASGGKVRLHAALYDTSTQRLVREFDSLGAPGEVVDQLAASLKGGPVIPTNSAALEAFGKSVREKDPDTRRTRLQDALNADAGFTPAAIGLAQTQPPEEAKNTLRAAIAKHPEGWERSRMDLALATIERDPTAILKAMESCLRYAPNDTDMARGLGDALINRHRYAEGVQWLAKAASLEPETRTWNLLSYAYAYSGDLKQAERSLEQYQRSSPNDPNASDTAGEVNWFFGRFREAEASFLEAQKRDPQFLGGLEFSKAALARFLTGDTNAADQIFARYLESRRALNDPLVDLRSAHWLFLTDRKDKAKQAARDLAAKPSEVAVLAQSFLALWQLQEGDPAAAESAKQAMSRARTPATATQAGLLMLLTQPRASAEEWNSRVNRALGPQTPPALRRLILAYALMLGKHYKEARTLLETMHAETPPAAGDEIRMMLAKAKLETGDAPGAKNLLTRYALPPQPGESVYASLWFPEFRQWRKAAGL
ncbi:MAG: hypothetical protein U0R19_35360 [Bryobacteraceae bacterium]